jgi:uncharacterized repeat protein (TIGR03803 family)
MGNLLLGQVSVLIVALLTVASLAPQSGAAPVAQEPETVLYSFCAQGGESCTDGEGPFAGLITDAGKLYVTTSLGGAHGGGTVFALTPNAAKTKWTETVLYSFCSQSDCADCSGPKAGLITDAGGHLYGTTYFSGAYDGGHGVRAAVNWLLLPGGCWREPAARFPVMRASAGACMNPPQ